MFNWLVRHFIKDYKEVSSARVRQKYALLCSIAGIILNILLFGVKMAAGALSHSITIISDGFNNLTDAGTTLVSMLGFKMAGYGAGRHHPFGHGRIEWIMGLFASVSIIFVGVELVNSSVKEIINPTETEFNTVIAFILIFSIVVKLFMYGFNHKIGLKINATTLLAAASDCMSDSIATLSVLAASLLAYYTGWKIDGWSGAVVSCLIIYSGYQTVSDILGRIVGVAPNEELLQEIDSIIKEYPVIEACYDLLVSDYGFGRYGIHMRIAGNSKDEMEIHKAGEEISLRLFERYGSDCMIQSEVFSEDKEENRKVLQLLKDLLEQEKAAMTSIDQFRIIRTGNLKTVYFDLIIPCGDESRQEDRMIQTLKQAVKICNPRFHVVIHPKIINVHRELKKSRKEQRRKNRSEYRNKEKAGEQNEEFNHQERRD